MLALFTGQAALAAPTQFTSDNYGIESVIFGGTGVLRSTEASVPPVITAGPTVSDIATTSVTVSWTTDKPSNSVVLVGTESGTYTFQSGDLVDATITSHSVDVTNLKRGVTYYYKVRSSDVSGNLTQSAESTFTTDPGDITPPVVTSGPTIAYTSATAVTVTWQTNELANTIVEYGVKAVDENAIGHSDELTLFHQVQLNSLTAAQHYLVRIKSKDASGNLYTSPTQDMVTLNAPAITDVKITNVTLDSAQISWQTSTPYNTTVNYGPTSDYGQSSTDLTGFTQSHSVSLGQLQNGTVYKFRISGEDQSGNRISSDEYSFKTVILPLITGLTISNVTSDGVLVTWNSSSDINEFISYVTDVPDGSGVGASNKLSTVHSYQVSHLIPSTDYSLEVEGTDAFGNKAVSSTLTFRTAPDTTPPDILNIKSDTSVDLGSRQSVQVLVSFGLSEPGKAYIQYAKGAGAKFDQKIETDTELGVNKFMVIPGLSPGQTYHFQIVARDRVGNTTYSADYLVLAPTQPVSLLDLISQQISDNFSWLGSL